MAPTYRYPGTKSFATEDQRLFFGRAKDIDRLSKMIALERMVVLYGKSGRGKTSLLNAGVIPQMLAEDKDLHPVFVRFRGAIAGQDVSLHDIFLQNVGGGTTVKPFRLLQQLGPDDGSLWSFFKHYQYQQGLKKTYLLIFDQFEEFFTHPEALIEEFLRDFSELFYTEVPQRYRDALVQQSRENPRFATDKEVEALFTPIQLKLVFGIRVDRLSEMNKLAAYFPRILTNAYELRPLRREEAQDAIVRPASLAGKFISPPFVLAPKALEKMLNALADRDDHKIECFQLQIVCQNLENLAIELDKQIQASQKVKTESIIIPDLDEKWLKATFENHYKISLSQFSEEDRAIVRLLLEEELLYNGERRHLVLEDVLKEKTHATDQLLAQLVNINLIRREVLPGQHGTYYEISHDQFIKPLQDARRERKLQEERRRMAEEFEAQQRKAIQMRDFEEARRLDDVERRQARIMRKASKRAQLRFFFTQLQRREKLNQLKGLLVISAFVTVVLTIVGLGIYAFVSERNEDKRQEQLRLQLKETNERFKRIFAPQNTPGALPSQDEVNKLLKEYQVVEEGMKE